MLMQLHLMLKIFVCDAWLALWNFFLEILFQNLRNNFARLKMFTKQRFINKQTVEKEICIHIIDICCNSGMLVKSIVIGYQTDNLKAETSSSIHHIRKWFVFELWFPSSIVSAHLYVAMKSWQIECINNKNNRNVFRNLIKK